MATNLGKEGILNQINVITFSRYFHHVVFSNMAFKNMKTLIFIFYYVTLEFILAHVDMM